LVANPPDETELPAKEFRLPLAVRLLSLLCVALLGGVTVLVFGFAVAVLLTDLWVLGAVLALATAVLAVLTHYVARDLQGKWSLRVVLGADAVTLSLPKNRSLVHATPPQTITMPYGEIAAIETRLEAYPTLGMVNMQQPYVLRRKTGDTVFLFEDRAIGTGLKRSYFGALANEIAARAKVEVRDLGMSEGGGGVLGVVRTHEADWAAPALPAARQARLIRKAVDTGKWAFLLISLAFAVRWAVAYLR
jgi:hypothetical protein